MTPLLVVLLSLHGIINTGTARYVQRGLDEAKAESAALVVVELDTPGGLLSSTREIVKAIAASPVPVAVYVAPTGAQAASAGTIITMAAHYAAMAPGTNIGAAHPVGGHGEDIKGTMKVKAENDTVAFIRAQAALRGRNTEWAEQAIRKSVSVPADEAVALHVVDFLAPDLSTLLAKIDATPVHGPLAGHVGLGARVHVAGVSPRPLPMTFTERLLAFLGDPNVSYMLMTLGGLGIYIELTAPGVILPGVLGSIALILAFVSLTTLPVSTGAVALLALGLVLFGIEPFVPSHGALTAGGVVSFVVGALFLMSPASGDLRISLALVLPVAIVFAALSFLLAYFAVRSRKQRYGGLTSFSDFEGVVESVDETQHAGKCAIRGETWDFELSHPRQPVQIGDRISVVERHGMKLIVTKKNPGNSN